LFVIVCHERNIFYHYYNMIKYDFLSFIRVQRQTGALVAAQNSRLYSSQAAEVRPVATSL